ncbi:hypothetical protein AVEN_58912-1 [Araneus ventricosus]|uniref:Uncharacterized protein n=1 Tax=Araneus ventricosus TaxID=182803 RepID=A0A4Y2EQI7_ARAVE|nr:hypothetical protein AVEN_58912-1 [Araneus ventricosus]
MTSQKHSRSGKREADVFSSCINLNSKQKADLIVPRLNKGSRPLIRLPLPAPKVKLVPALLEIKNSFSFCTCLQHCGGTLVICPDEHLDTDKEWKDL